jgi:hypothetical protein
MSMKLAIYETFDSSKGSIMGEQSQAATNFAFVE